MWRAKVGNGTRVDTFSSSTRLLHGSPIRNKKHKAGLTVGARDLHITARPAASMNELIEESLNGLSRWVESRQYRAYDPGDGQMSFLRPLTFGSKALERVLTAAVLRSPFNIRPLLGIKPHTSTKGMGYMAWGHLRRFQSGWGPAPRPEGKDVPRLVAGPPVARLQRFVLGQ